MTRVIGLSIHASEEHGTARGIKRDRLRERSGPALLWLRWDRAVVRSVARPRGGRYVRRRRLAASPRAARRWGRATRGPARGVVYMSTRAKTRASQAPCRMWLCGIWEQSLCVHERWSTWMSWFHRSRPESATRSKYLYCIFVARTPQSTPPIHTYSSVLRSKLALRFRPGLVVCAA